MPDNCCVGVLKHPNRKANMWSMNRAIVRRSWNTENVPENKHFAQTPMRLAWNSGDPMLRQDYTCGGGTQTNASRPGMGRLIGGLVDSNGCGAHNAIAPSYANNKWVYDGADRVKFLKEQSINRYYKAHGPNPTNYTNGNNQGTESAAINNVAIALWRVRRR